jgi:hypothetical protein
MVGELQVRDTSSMFSVACWSQKPAARCDELLGQDISVFTMTGNGRHAGHRHGHDDNAVISVRVEML